MSSGPWERFQSAEEGPWTRFQEAKPSVAADLIKTIPASLARGEGHLLGLPGSLASGLRWGVDAAIAGGDLLANRLVSGAWDHTAAYQRGVATVDQAPAIGPESVFTGARINEGVNRGLQGLGLPPLYEPQTTPGKYVNAVGETLPAAAATGGLGTVRGALTNAVGPALASEAAGQATAGTAWEPAARVGGALLGAGGVNAALPGGTTAREAAGRSVRNLTDDQWLRAEELAAASRNLPAGYAVPLAADEVLNAVTGGEARGLSNLSRIAGNSGERGGQPAMDRFYAQRPLQVENAGNAAVASLAPVGPGAPRLDPVQTGLRTQRAAEREIADTQAAINTQTQPLYDQAGVVRVGPQVHAALLDDPIYARELERIRSDPTLNRTISNAPDDSVAVINLVQQRLREQAENARIPGEATSSNLRALNLEDARTAPIQAAEQVTGGPQGTYASARAEQRLLRQNELQPLTQGPMGDISRTSDAMSQARSLIGPNVPSNMDAVVAQTTRSLVRRDPQAASALVRNYAQTVFDDAITTSKGQPDLYGGAKFFDIIAGNPSRASNFEAAVRSLPQGHQRFEGFRNFLATMEATGWKPQTGSMTAFNQQFMKEASRGGKYGEIAEQIPKAGLGAPARLSEMYRRYRLAGNTSELADILTRPDAIPLLRALAKEPVGSARARALSLRLGYVGMTALARSPEQAAGPARP